MLLTKEEENRGKKYSRIQSESFGALLQRKKKRVEMRKFVKMVLADSCHD